MKWDPGAFNWHKLPILNYSANLLDMIFLGSTLQGLSGYELLYCTDLSLTPWFVKAGHMAGSPISNCLFIQIDQRPKSNRVKTVSIFNLTLMRKQLTCYTCMRMVLVAIGTPEFHRSYSEQSFHTSMIFTLKCKWSKVCNKSKVMPSGTCQEPES